MTKKAAILQSNYIPWKGYFDIIHDVDLFVFYDDVQYTKNDWRNRNRIKTAAGVEWLTIPVGDGCDRMICEIELPSDRWQIKHWRSIQQNYGKSAYFGRYRDYFESVYVGQRWRSLSELNQSMCRHIACEFLGIATRFADSRHYQVQGKKQQRLLEILSQCGADAYLSGPAARDYIEPAAFERAGIALDWKDYTGYPEHAQRFAPFEHAVSILDLLFHTGPDAPWYIWGWRSNPLGPAR